MHFNRRHAAAITLAALAALGVNSSALAQDRYPSRPVTLIVPQAPGGANDTIARIVAQKLSEALGQQFIVDNKPGAGGNIGTAAAAKAKNDGYTLMLTVNSAHVINPSLYKSTGFDPVKDFDPITPVATAGYVLVANNSFAPKTVAELIAAAKAAPGKYMIASAGNGTLNHLIGEMLGKAAGIELTHVPYKGASAAVTDLVGGQVQAAFMVPGNVLQFAKEGRLRLVASSGAKRFPGTPDIPTLVEAGYPDLVAVAWIGFLTAGGTPRPIIDRYHKEIVKIVNSPEIRDKLTAMEFEIVAGTPEHFSAWIRSEIPRWGKVIKATGAKAD